MAVTYDPAVIQKFAERLYRRAATIVLTYAFLGFLVGFLAGLVFAVTQRAGLGGGLVVGLVLGAFLAVPGMILAREKADALRLQAQQALCQMQIEANTRSAASRQAA